MSTIKSQVVSGVKWSLFAKGASQLFSWISTFFVIRILTPNDFGIIELATAIISLAMALGISGFSDVIVQKKEHDTKLCNQVFTISLLVNLLLFIIIFSSAGAVAQWFDAPNLEQVVQLLSVNVLTIAFTVVPSGILKRDMKFKPLSLIQLVMALSNAAISLTFALNGFQYWSIPLGAFFSMIIFAVLINAQVRQKVAITFDFSDFRTYFNFGMFTIINRTLNFIFLKADTFIIGKALGIAPLGTYSVGSQLANLPLEKTAATLNQISYSGYAQIKNEPNSVAYYFVQSNRILSILVFPIFWGMAAVAELIIGILLGEKWLGAVVVFQLLALAMPFRIFQLATHSAIAGLGNPKFNTKNLFVLCLLIPPSIAIGVNWGIAGAALAWSIAYLLFFVWMMGRSLGYLNVKVQDFLAAIFKPIISGILMVVCTLQVISFMGDSSLVTLISAIIAGAVTYAVTLLVLDKEVIQTIKKLKS